MINTNNFKEAKNMLLGIYDLAVYNKNQENIAKVKYYARLLESLIEQAKGNVIPDKKTILEAEKWLEMVRGIVSKKQKKEDVEYFTKRTNLLRWLIHLAKKGVVSNETC